MTELETDTLDRRSGISVWRQVADRLRRDIAAGRPAEGERLPPENALAERFGVNRHTIRAALAALASEGVVATRQGQGTTVSRRRRLAYPIARRTRFAEGLGGQARSARVSLLSADMESAEREAALALELEEGAAVIRIETVSEADGWPVASATHWFTRNPRNSEARSMRNPSIQNRPIPYPTRYTPISRPGPGSWLRSSHSKKPTSASSQSDSYRNVGWKVVPSA